jgi:hypothetical protein
MGQQPAQPLVSPVDVYPGGSFGASQGSADLLIGQFQDVSHDDRRRLPTGKAEQGAGNSVMQFLPVQPLLDRTVFRVQAVGVGQCPFP